MTKHIDMSKVKCPSCGEIGSVELHERLEDVQVRDVNVKVHKVSRQCNNCEAAFENTKDHDWKLEAFDAYRAALGMPTPGDIKSWRNSYDLTQAEVSSLLGWGLATLGRYEKGSLPTVTQSDHLKSIMSEDGLLRAIDDKPEAVEAAKRSSIVEKLRPLAVKKEFIKVVRNVYHSTDVNLNGGSNFSFEKTAAIIAVLCTTRQLKTKLNKLLFYTDFISKSINGVSITGIQYARINHGPVPQDFSTLYACMNSLEVVQIEEDQIGDFQCEYLRSIDESYLSFLKADEVKIANAVRDYFVGWTATRISDYSHLEKAWTEVQQAKPIPYTYADSLNLLSEIRLPE